MESWPRPPKKQNISEVANIKKAKLTLVMELEAKLAPLMEPVEEI